MYGIVVRSDPRWSYDDPSGVPEEVAVTVRLPERLLESVQREADRTGVTPAGWLLELIERTLRPTRPSAA
jgi:hypothetical protein